MGLSSLDDPAYTGIGVLCVTNGPMGARVGLKPVISFFLTFGRFVRAIIGAWKDPILQASASLVALTMLSGTLFYHNVEGWSWLDSAFFTVVTMSTVGYGNLVPLTAPGKIFTMILILILILILIFVGVGLFVALASRLAAALMKAE